MTEPTTVVPGAVPVECFRLMPLEVAQRLQAVPVARDGATVTVAMVDPTDMFAVDDVRLALPKLDLVAVAAPTGVIDAVLTRWARLHAAEAEGAAVREISADQQVEEDADAATEEGRMAKLVGQLIDAAISRGASDVHVEPTDKTLDIRFRVDGVLRPHATYPRTLTSGIINRLKVVSAIDVSERRVPQDGRFQRTAGGVTVDCRVVTLPTEWGLEGAVVRLFDQGRAGRTLAEIGFTSTLRAQFEQQLAAPHGAILVTGPTGSGKTTTLYGALGLVATDDRKTLAIEDPVEIRLSKITQMQVNEKANLTFAEALRSFLRADPDVILVGEIRDGETAQLAAQAALTGHLVLSTLHTNTAAGAPARLVDLGLKSYIIASALRAVLAQRLLRRLCPSCRVEYTPTADELAAAGWPEDLPRPQRLWRAGGGCIDCSDSGYAGRFAVGELLVVDDEMAEAILRGASERELSRIAATNGTVPMRVDALEHVAAGMTSLDELARVGV